jgi:hypothetical protein
MNTFGWDLPPGVTNADIEMQSRDNHRDEYIVYLRTMFKDNLATVEEYIREAEHQDGEEYWDNFETLEELAEDFKLYKEAI